MNMFDRERCTCFLILVSQLKLLGLWLEIYSFEVSIIFSLLGEHLPIFVIPIC